MAFFWQADDGPLLVVYLVNNTSTGPFEKPLDSLLYDICGIGSRVGSDEIPLYLRYYGLKKG